MNKPLEQPSICPLEPVRGGVPLVLANFEPITAEKFDEICGYVLSLAAESLISARYSNAASWVTNMIRFNARHAQIMKLMPVALAVLEGPNIRSDDELACMRNNQLWERALSAARAVTRYSHPWEQVEPVVRGLLDAMQEDRGFGIYPALSDAFVHTPPDYLAELVAGVVRDYPDRQGPKNDYQLLVQLTHDRHIPTHIINAIFSHEDPRVRKNMLIYVKDDYLRLDKTVIAIHALNLLGDPDPEVQATAFDVVNHLISRHESHDAVLQASPYARLSESGIWALVENKHIDPNVSLRFATNYFDYMTREVMNCGFNMDDIKRLVGEIRRLSRLAEMPGVDPVLVHSMLAAANRLAAVMHEFACPRGFRAPARHGKPVEFARVGIR